MTNAHWKRHCLQLCSGNKELHLIQSPAHNTVQLWGLPKAIQNQQKSVMFTLTALQACLRTQHQNEHCYSLSLFFYIPSPLSRELFFSLFYSYHWQQRHSFNWTAQDDCKRQFESVQDPSEALLLSGRSHLNYIQMLLTDNIMFTCFSISLVEPRGKESWNQLLPV